MSFFPCRQAISGLDQNTLKVFAVSSVGIGGLLCYLAWRKIPQKIPVGDGWWIAGEMPLIEDKTVRPFVVETSEQMLQVIKIVCI